jgi:hypothetical protein
MSKYGSEITLYYNDVDGFIVEKNDSVFYMMFHLTT